MLRQYKSKLNNKLDAKRKPMALLNSQIGMFLHCDKMIYFKIYFFNELKTLNSNNTYINLTEW